MKKTILVLLLSASLTLTGCLSLSYDRSTPQPSNHRHGDQYRDDGAQRYDRDGDGIPNRYDRAPNNPYR